VLWLSQQLCGPQRLPRVGSDAAGAFDESAEATPCGKGRLRRLPVSLLARSVSSCPSDSRYASSSPAPSRPFSQGPLSIPAAKVGTRLPLEHRVPGAAPSQHPLGRAGESPRRCEFNPFSQPGGEKLSATSGLHLRRVGLERVGSRVLSPPQDDSKRADRHRSLGRAQAHRPSPACRLASRNILARFL
jgi:hypothetical protein